MRNDIIFFLPIQQGQPCDIHGRSHRLQRVSPSSHRMNYRSGGTARGRLSPLSRPSPLALPVRDSLSSRKASSECRQSRYTGLSLTMVSTLPWMVVFRTLIFAISLAAPCRAFSRVSSIACLISDCLTTSPSFPTPVPYQYEPPTEATHSSTAANPTQGFMPTPRMPDGLGSAAYRNRSNRPPYRCGDQC